MAQIEAYRQLVESRAGGACEYCRLLQAATGVTFHIEHFVPRSKDGLTVMTNLVLSCPGCNLAKAERTTGQDQLGQTQLLFNPRDYEPWLLGWHLHFSLDTKSGIVVPRTPNAEATVETLRINAPLRVFARKLQISVGLIG
jgi:HNH endonuclease